MVVVDIIVLFRGSKYRINKQLGQTNNQKKNHKLEATSDSFNLQTYTSTLESECFAMTSFDV